MSNKSRGEAFLKEMNDLQSNADQKFDVANHASKNSEQVISTIQQDTERMVGVIDRAPSMIHDINTQFEMATKLKGKDYAFLFGAAAVQVARWAFLPSIDWDFKPLSKQQRLDSAAGGRIEKTGIKERLQKEGFSRYEINDMLDNTHINNYTWEKLLIATVPYDAMHGSARIKIAGFEQYKAVGKELCGANHHAATWGHDPIFGWVIGPLNITSRMITFRDFQTFHVMQVGDTFEQKITKKATNEWMLKKSIENWTEDSKKLFVSVAKQGLHLQSDKYTKYGLPIPLLKPTTAQTLLLKGWNSNEVERLFAKAFKNLGIIGAQYTLALIIDNLVSAAHLLCYDKSVDGQVSAYKVKTQKIVCYSNLLAEVANSVYVAATGQLGKLDIGGYVNLAKNLIANEKFKTEVKNEFLQKELEKRLYGEEYYFTEVKEHGI